jgi:hypothetical protein
MTVLRITAKHPIRGAIADLPTYFDCKGDAIAAVREACDGYGLCVEDSGLPGNSGYATWELRSITAGQFICACCDEKADRATFDNCIYIAWYTMCTGRIEIVAYVT